MGHCPPHWFGHGFERLNIGTFLPLWKPNSENRPPRRHLAGNPSQIDTNATASRNQGCVEAKAAPTWDTWVFFWFRQFATPINFGCFFVCKFLQHGAIYCWTHTQLEITIFITNTSLFKTPAFSQSCFSPHPPSPSITGARGPWKQSTLCGIDTWDTKKTTPTFHWTGWFRGIWSFINPHITG